MTEFSSEHEEQKGFVMWFRQRYPNTLIFAIPNGGKRHLSVALRLKEEGVVPGVPDLFVPEWKLFIEMKRERQGTVSCAQQQIIAKLTKCGYTVIIGKGARDASLSVLQFVKTNKYADGI